MNKNELQSIQGKCENCGANLEYSINKKALFCDSCGSTVQVNDENKTVKHILNDIDVQNEQFDESVVNIFKCQNCGADITLNSFEISKGCPYCESPNVIAIEDIVGLKPDKIVRFEFEKEEASKRFVAHVKKKFFVPNPFKKSTPKQNISSLYFSSFSFDADSHTLYNGKLYRYEKRNGEEIKKIFYVRGNIGVNHRNVLVESSRQLSQTTLNYVLPYNLEKKVDFKQEYLLGFTVERYDNAFKDSVKNANTIMKKEIESAIIRLYNADGVEVLSLNTHYHNRLYEYIILPIYFVEYEYRKKKYITYMNGQTGKVGGKLPKSPIKIAFVSILGILIFAFFVFILPMLLN